MQIQRQSSFRVDALRHGVVGHGDFVEPRQ